MMNAQLKHNTDQFKMKNVQKFAHKNVFYFVSSEMSKQKIYLNGGEHIFQLNHINDDSAKPFC